MCESCNTGTSVNCVPGERVLGESVTMGGDVASVPGRQGEGEVGMVIVGKGDGEVVGALNCVGVASLPLAVEG